MKKTVIYVVILVIVSLVVGLVIGLNVKRRGNMHLRSGYGNVERFQDVRNRAAVFGKISQRLNLTEEQKQKLKEILENARAQIIEARKGGVEKFSVVKEETNAKIGAILNPTQRAEFDKMIAEFKARRAMKDQAPHLE